MEPELSRRLERVENLLSLALMASGPSLPVTSVATVFSGNLIGTIDRYLTLYTNSYERLVAVKVVADFVIPGSTVDLSLQTTENGIIDTLSSSGNIISGTVWLPPRKSLYINTADTAFSLNGSVFRVLLFDPLSFINE